MPRFVLSRRSSALMSILLGCSFFVTSLATAPPAHATTTSEYKMAHYVNNSRDSRGFAKLRVSGALSDLARKHSKQMAAAGSIFHTKDLGYTLRSYSWSVAGENVGRGGSLWDIHVAMMNSDGHRANILYRGFKKIGVGVVWSGGRVYVTEMFMG